MRKITRRKPKETKTKKIKRRKIKVDRLSVSGKCKKCEMPYLYCFESADKDLIESKPAMAKRFINLQKSELCLRCLTMENNTIKAWEIMQMYVVKGVALPKEKS